MQEEQMKDHQHRKDLGKAAIFGADMHAPAVSPGSHFGGERTEPGAAPTLHRPPSYNRWNQLQFSLGSSIPKLSRKPDARQELGATGEGSPVWKTWKVTDSGS